MSKSAAEPMTDAVAYCAHLTVLYTTEEVGDGSVRGYWCCRECGSKFTPLAVVDAEVRRLRGENDKRRGVMANKPTVSLGEVGRRYGAMMERKGVLRKVRAMITARELECIALDYQTADTLIHGDDLVLWILDRAKRKGEPVKGKPVMNGPYPERGGPVW